MNVKLPKVTGCVAVLTWLGASAAQAQTTSPPADGQQLVAQAAENLARQPSVEAQLRHRVQLLDRFLIGSGSYRQLVIGHRHMFRLEMKLPVTDRMTSLLEVSDGTTLWIRRGQGGEQSLAYVSLSRVAKAVKAAGGSRVASAPADMLALGGLHQLLRGLEESFAFGPPVAGRIGDQPVWKLTATWKPQKLAQLFPEQQAEITAGGPVELDRLPPHLPHTVSLALGRDDQIPLFPYRIEYGRSTRRPRARWGGSGTSGKDELEYTPIATMELYEVRRYLRMDPHDFSLQPGGEQIEDRTDDVLRRWGLLDEAAP